MTVLVNEKFDSDPTNLTWFEIGTITTWSAGKMNISAVEGSTERFYTKHVPKTDNDKMFYGFKHLIESGFDGRLLIGDFKKDLPNVQNFVGILFDATELKCYACFGDTEGYLHYGPSITVAYSIEYICEVVYEDRTITAKVYNGSTLVGSSQRAVPTDKHFTVDCKGLGNYDESVLRPVYQGTYDDAYMRIPGGDLDMGHFNALRAILHSTVLPPDFPIDGLWWHDKSAHTYKFWKDDERLWRDILGEMEEGEQIRIYDNDANKYLTTRPLIQIGTVLGSANNVTVTFDIPFVSIPIVICGALSISQSYAPAPHTITATSFKCNHNALADFVWYAIGNEEIERTKSFDLDAILAKLTVKDFDLDAMIINRSTKLFDVDAILFVHEATYFPDDDSYIDQNEISTTHDTLALRVLSRGAPTRNCRTVVKFDLSAIPPSAIISEAKLELWYADKGNQDPVGRTYNLYELLATWAEETITWGNCPSYSNFVNNFIVPSFPPGSWVEVDVKNSVQAFVEGTRTNYGWLLRDSVESEGNDYRSSYQCKEGVSGWPKLTVKWKE